MTTGIRAVFDRMRQDDLRHDPWGTSLNWHFAVCDLMVEWAPPYPPPEWGYSNPFGPEDDSYPYQELAEMITAGEFDPGDLLALGTVLDRYENLLIRAGRDY